MKAKCLADVFSAGIMMKILLQADERKKEYTFI